MSAPTALSKAVLKLPLALSGGDTATLADYAGAWLVLYFYPKDSTPGCTTEGLDFNALLPKFKKLNATVLGVSRDSVKSHDNFCAKQGFKFPLVNFRLKLYETLTIHRANKDSPSFRGNCTLYINSMSKSMLIINHD